MNSKFHEFMSSFRFLPPDKPTWKMNAAIWNGAGWSDTYGGDCMYFLRIIHFILKFTPSKNGERKLHLFPNYQGESKDTINTNVGFIEKSL
jgi:hypothetical protein